MYLIFSVVVVVFLHRDAILTSSVNCFTSFLAGFAVFSVLGHMAKESGTDIANVAREGKTFSCAFIGNKPMQYTVIFHGCINDNFG